MRRLVRLGVLTLVALVAGWIAVYLTDYYIGLTPDATAKGTVAASAVTLFGVVFSALYKEISSYYQERAR